MDYNIKILMDDTDVTILARKELLHEILRWAKSYAHEFKDKAAIQLIDGVEKLERIE